MKKEIPKTLKIIPLLNVFPSSAVLEGIHPNHLQVKRIIIQATLKRSKCQQLKAEYNQYQNSNKISYF